MWFFKNKVEPKAPFFVWSDLEHSVGIRIFDAEHQRLAEMMAQIHDVLLKEHDRPRALKLIEKLVQETRDHFAHEELVMAEAQFSDLESHAAEHMALIAQAQDMLRQFRTGAISARLFPSFLRDLLIPHIQEYDRKYTETLRRLGLR